MRPTMCFLLGLALVPMCAQEVRAQAVGSNPGKTASIQPDKPTQPAGGPVFPDGVRLGYVDVNLVAALSGEGKAVAAKLQELRSRKSAEVTERSKQVETLQLKLSQGESVLNAAARTQLQRQFRRAQIDFQRFTEDAQAEVQEAEQEMIQAFNARLFPVIGQVAKEKNLWAVFGSESGLLWHDPALDLSEEVAKRLDGSAAPKR
jgi:outer membrane protein